ncbi:hypothetical protein B1C78_14410 [Thioalkalivibrio denitrificans]|uniref:Uncharacterized protein n=1 Tax=Thioalkalivibrio denitrificans TaxID=108003 RepID=A0A1V3NBZ9_9GAMM|nr:hypothetical protein B1C78_14410 [Thioalkalivibrio denitrificans]
MAGSFRSISMAGASRLKSSIQLKVRQGGLSHSASDMKSADQVALAASGTASGCGARLYSRFMPLRRRFELEVTVHAPHRLVVPGHSQARDELLKLRESPLRVVLGQL